VAGTGIWLGALSPGKQPAESAVDVVHEGIRQVAGRSAEVGLVKGHQGSDIDHGIPRQARGRRWDEDVAGHRREPRVRGDHCGHRGAEPTSTERPGLDHQDWPAFRRRTPRGLPRGQPSRCLRSASSFGSVITASMSSWDPSTQVKSESTSVATNHRRSAGHRRCGAGSSSSLDEPVAGSVAPQ
jgi:hypothetical protein